ncbi:ABC transporter ATP-binding protein [Companilactobacillus sp.]|uniref:ABC transporter ATP-binding protein n=1 Tax=Companilactobacillus sp. TaxID=2767905 RepID=UPI002634EADF|nr:ABC transporter ATP-binding protein [Companilactobacillus sp.]
MEQPNLIKVDHLAKHFSTDDALKNVSFKVHRGEIFGFLGPSGAGKTTTIKILTGQLTPTSGNVEVLGKSVSEIDSKLYEQIGIVTHNSGLYERMTVYDNLLFFAKILNVDKTRIDEILTRVGLEKDKKKLASKISNGMRQRLVLARSILHDPKLLFLDEPTSGLDPSTAASIHELLKELSNSGTAIFLTTHNMEEATKLCDQVALLNEGVIEELGSPRELSLKYNTNLRYSVTLKNGEEMALSQSADTAKQIFEFIHNEQLETIHSNEPSLEKIFLHVTGRKLG